MNLQPESVETYFPKYSEQCDIEAEINGQTAAHLGKRLRYSADVLSLFANDKTVQPRRSMNAHTSNTICL